MKNLNYQPIEWLGNKAIILDQTCLPGEEVYLEITSYQAMTSAIKELKIRGAPAIGVAGAYGIVLGALETKAMSREHFLEKLRGISQTIKDTRPTAKNLPRAIERMEQIANASNDIGQIKKALVNEATKIHREEVEATQKLSQIGADLIEDNSTILTHCNAGPMATTGYGTALGVIISAREQGKKIKIFANETRPLLQGARLTTWELKKAGIPVTLITDSMAGYFMSRGQINCIIVGADRIAANGDTANKIGTYTLAVLAKEHGIPFYAAAPTTTIDPSLPSGKEIPIEERKPEEVTHFQGVVTAPAGIEVTNPAFDVTPHHYITAIITENGIIREPLGKGIARIC